RLRQASRGGSGGVGCWTCGWTFPTIAFARRAIGYAWGHGKSLSCSIKSRSCSLRSFRSWLSGERAGGDPRSASSRAVRRRARAPSRPLWRPRQRLDQRGRQALHQGLNLGVFFRLPALQELIEPVAARGDEAFVRGAAGRGQGEISGRACIYVVDCCLSPLWIALI